MPNAPTHLRCESLENPIGLDVTVPRLSWRLNDDRRGAKQTAYQLLIARADAPSTALWDSGKVASDQTTQVEYAGPALTSRDRLVWRVKYWDQDGVESPFSPDATIEMGLLTRDDWKGTWIGSHEMGGPRTIPPCPYLRKTFDLSSKPVRARLYITALGLFEAELNGTPVGEDVFAPGRTEYGKRVPYHVYDVTDQLAAGANAIGVILGDGWYSGHVHSDPRMFYGDRPRLLAQLEVTFADGSTQTFASDASWKETTAGPIRSSDLLQGEDYDARMEIAGWSASGFDDSSWRAVKTFDFPDIALVGRRMPPVRRIEELKPSVAPWPTPNKRRWTFDFGQNLVGRVRIKLRNTKPGQIITIRHAEMLDKNGRLYTEALRSARATDYYTCKGAAEETYEPRFTFHGFRYIEVNGLKFGAPPDSDVVSAIVLHSDLDVTGTFECSSQMINQLQSNIVWSQKGNFLEIPTDCPQRDERLGWTGDAQVFIRTAAWNMDVSAFFTKWLTDMADAQFETGGIPSTVPFCVSIPSEGGPAWSDAAVICPWTIYQCYGDERILESAYPMMRKFVEFLKATSNGLIRADETKKWRGYGDWLSQNADTPKDLIGTAYFAHVCHLMSNIARVLTKRGRESFSVAAVAEERGPSPLIAKGDGAEKDSRPLYVRDAEGFAALRDEVKRAWRDKYVTPAGEIVGQTQTAYLLALAFDLIPEALRPKVFDALVRDITARGTHLSTGFVGTPLITKVLADGGRLDLAYALLNQTTFPGWLFPITHGATTMWERWDGWTPDKGFNDSGMNSYNHYAYGAVGEWMYATIAGIDLDPEAPGYAKIRIAPRPGGGMTSARGSLLTPHGRVETSWTLAGSKFTLDVTIPPNTTATIHLPTADAEQVREGGAPANQAKGLMRRATQGGAGFDAVAGRYRFECPITA